MYEGGKSKPCGQEGGSIQGRSFFMANQGDGQLNMLTIHHILENSLFRFIVVGISNTLISYLVFAAFYFLVFTNNAWVSQLFSYGSGIIWSFYWNRKWTFESHGNALTRFVFFILMQISMLLLSSYAIHILVDMFKHNPTLSWVGVMAVITVLNYMGSRYWIFRDGRRVGLANTGK